MHSNLEPSFQSTCYSSPHVRHALARSWLDGLRPIGCGLLAYAPPALVLPLVLGFRTQEVERVTGPGDIQITIKIMGIQDLMYERTPVSLCEPSRGRSSTRSMSRSMSRSNSRSMSRSMSRSNSRSMSRSISRSNSRTMSRTLQRQQSRGGTRRGFWLRMRWSHLR